MFVRKHPTHIYGIYTYSIPMKLYTYYENIIRGIIPNITDKTKR